MRQIFPGAPGRGPAGSEGSDPLERGGAAAVQALARLYAHPSPGGRPWLRANMVCSVDGAASLSGRSGGLSGYADHLVFGVLRGLADIILVGAGTARAERYRPARPSELSRQLRGGREPPPVAVVTRRLDLDPGSPLLTAAGGPSQTVVLTTEAAPADRRAAVGRHARVIVAGARTVTPAAAIAALAGLGYRRILTEGGPRLLGQIAADGLLDDLCVTYSPLLAGGPAGRIIADPRPAAGRSSGDAAGGAGPGGALGRLTLAHVLEDEGSLLCRYLRVTAG